MPADEATICVTDNVQNANLSWGSVSFTILRSLHGNVTDQTGPITGFSWMPSTRTGLELILVGGDARGFAVARNVSIW